MPSTLSSQVASIASSSGRVIAAFLRGRSPRLTAARATRLSTVRIQLRQVQDAVQAERDTLIQHVRATEDRAEAQLGNLRDLRRHWKPHGVSASSNIKPRIPSRARGTAATTPSKGNPNWFAIERAARLLQLTQQPVDAYSASGGHPAPPTLRHRIDSGYSCSLNSMSAARKIAAGSVLSISSGGRTLQDWVEAFCTLRRKFLLNDKWDRER
ncbi:hypothetical protein [Pseudomonas sp. Hp2]|uniref:hypothetical protein n=1 Tax=Pseudomonas sp. Hp2 TaxID=701189 RepID=UPI0015A9BB6E|nr:hypothetical protein [Pseudomonas sp. Hp2]